MVTRVLGRQQGLIVRRTGDELLILDTVKDQIHQLNPSAAFIWEKLDEGLSDGDISQLLSVEFGIDDEVARSDVAAAVARFRALGLIA